MIIQEEKVEIIEDEKKQKHESTKNTNPSQESSKKQNTKPKRESTKKNPPQESNEKTNSSQKSSKKEDENEALDKKNNDKKETDETKKQKFEPAPKSSSKEKTNSKKLITYILIFIIILIAILLIIFSAFTIYNIRNNDKIAKGIYIYGIDVSYLSTSEATEKISEVFEEISNTDITVISEDFETYINPSEIELEYDITSAVNYAYQIGKNGNIFTDNYDVFDAIVNGVNITPTYSINEEELATLLSEMSKDLPNTVIEGSYYIEDNTLVITKGTAGYVVDVDQTIEIINENISNFNYLTQSIELSLVLQEPEEMDLDEIYEAVYKEATDAYYTTDPYAVYPSSTGLDFDITLDEAKELLEEAETECEIPLKTLYPSVTTNMLGTEAFPDLLATYSTKYNTSNTDRVTNLKLAANKINGTVLLPGETFSYNEVVGERTIEAGYKEAGIYVNGEETLGLGGGICQISTTLFNAVLYANLEMVELYNHQMIPEYSSAGRDATVVYGSKDFQFKNTRDYAIKIECSVSGGTVLFNIYGVEEDTEYDVTISAQVTSQTSSYIKSTTYRILSLNGQTISREKIYSCTYLVH